MRRLGPDGMEGKGKERFGYSCDRDMFGLGLSSKLAHSARRSVMLKAGVEAEVHQQSPLCSYWLNLAGSTFRRFGNPPPSTTVDAQ
jgi:hypothetical protein